MLRALPFSTFGEIAALGLEVDVYCAHCRAYRRLDLSNERLSHRCFAGAPFRCWRCGGPGVPKIRPTELRPVGGSVTLAFLFCKRCTWEIDQAQLDQPPWSTSGLKSGDRFRCPGCSGRVDWHIHGPTWRPTYREHAVRPRGPLSTRGQIDRSNGTGPNPSSSAPGAELIAALGSPVNPVTVRPRMQAASIL